MPQHTVEIEQLDLFADISDASGLSLTPCAEAHVKVACTFDYDSYGDLSDWDVDAIYIVGSGTMQGSFRRQTRDLLVEPGTSEHAVLMSAVRLRKNATAIEEALQNEIINEYGPFRSLDEERGSDCRRAAGY